MSARSSLPLVVALVFGPAGAWASPRVAVQIETLFTPTGILYDAWTPFVTTVCGDAGEYRLELAIAPNWGAEPQRTIRDVRIPDDGGGGCTRTITELYLLGGDVRAIVRDSGGQKLAVGRSRLEGGRRQYALAVLGDPVSDLARRIDADHEVIRPILLPDTAIGWMPADAVLATSSQIAAMRPSEREALVDWVEIGGRLLIDSDREEPPGERETAAGPVQMDPSRPDLLLHLLDSGDSLARGLGRVVFLMGRPEDRALRAEEVLRERYVNGRPWLLWGPTNAESWAVMYAPARDAIDWNLRTRPPIGLVAGLLAAYVLLLGPFQFRWLTRRRRPILVLVTVPILSVATFGLLVGLGWTLKGGAARYDSLALLEAGPGGTVASARRYAGLFVTRPGSLEVRGAPGALLRELVGPGPGRPGARAQIGEASARGGAVTLDGIPVGLWETVFVREDSVVELGGAVDVERTRDGVEVVNHTRFALRDAMISPGSPGRRVRLGTIAPGERKVAHWSSATYSRLPRGFWLVPAPEAEGKAVLLARLDPEALPAFEGFARGREHNLFRLVAP